jgi:hypothetical protein
MAASVRILMGNNKRHIAPSAAYFAGSLEQKMNKQNSCVHEYEHGQSADVPVKIKAKPRPTQRMYGSNNSQHDQAEWLSRAKILFTSVSNSFQKVYRF